MPQQAYGEDLAYIHDVGFSDFVLNAAPEILGRLRHAGIRNGLVLDLGCGAGRWAKILIDAGYDVLGIDISPAMIRMARHRTPGARFRVGSLLQVPLPRCVAITAIGEVVNYAFDKRNSAHELRRLFRRVFDALAPGGLFLFDAAGPGQLRGDSMRTWMEGTDWALMLEKMEKGTTLSRRIVLFRKVGARYRRSEETHVLNLYDAKWIAAELRQTGFTVRLTRGYTRSLFRHGLTGFIARKTDGANE